MNSQKPSFPARAYWLLMLVATLAVFQIHAAVRALQIPGGSSLWPPLEIVSGLVWAALSIWTIAALWWRQSSARRRVGWLMMGFILYSLVRLIVFTRADYDRGRLPFLILATVGAVVVVGLRYAASFKMNNTGDY